MSGDIARAKTAAPAIRVSGVTKLYRRYGRKRSIGTLKSAFLSGAARKALSPDSFVPALVDVTFEVAPGEMIGVVGANGSGKSTLLKVLSGIVRPTSGQVAVSGRLAALLELGAGFHPEISGRENIEINGLLLGLTKREITARFDGRTLAVSAPRALVEQWARTEQVGFEANHPSKDGQTMRVLVEKDWQCLTAENEPDAFPHPTGRC